MTNRSESVTASRLPVSPESSSRRSNPLKSYLWTRPETPQRLAGVTMDRLNCDIPLNDTDKKTEVAAPLSSRREFLLAAAASSGAVILSAEFVLTTAGASSHKVAELVLPSATKAVTPFEIHMPAAALDDLKRRLANTRWPDKETVADWSQGVPLAKARAL